MPLVAIKIRLGVVHDIYVLEENGKCDVALFLEQFEVDDSQDFGRLTRLFDYTANCGRLNNERKFKYLGEKIFEFKTFGGIRVFCFFDGDRLVVLTNGFKKKKKYTEEIEKARTLRARYMNEKVNDTLTYRE